METLSITYFQKSLARNITFQDLITYLCAAPILVQANMVATAMGDTGMYMHTTSPFFTPRVFMTLAIWHVISSNFLEKELSQIHHLLHRH